MGKEKTIITTISIENIINNVLKQNPKNECEFNNLLAYHFTDTFLEKLNSQINLVKGGKKIPRKTKKQIRKNKTKKLRTKTQKGGANPQLILFLLSFLIIFAKGIKNMTHSDVTNRLKESFNVIDIYKNYYGTCTLNTMLFLKTIDLPTFEDLSIQLIQTKKGLTNRQIASYLNRQLEFHSRWYSFTCRDSDVNDEENAINYYIERIRNKLIQLRSDYGYSSDQDILTAMAYPKKGKDVGHAVVLWLTNKNEIVIIDPQKYYTLNKIVLYTSEAYLDEYMDNDKMLNLEPITTYIRDNIDVTSDWRETDIFESIHIEIEDIKEKSRLVPNNINLINTIARIKSMEESIEDKQTVEEDL
jgi:hypothetical protein